MKKRSLKKKSVYAALLLSILLSALAITISYSTYSSTVDEHYRNYAMNIAKVAASQMDGDKIAGYIAEVEALNPEDADYAAKIRAIKDDDYFAMLDILFEIKEGADTLYLYVEKVARENVTYVLDADVEGSACELGETFPLAENNYTYLDSLDQGLPAFITDTEDFGWLVTAGAPIFDSRGNVVALACADISMNKIMNDRQNFLILILLTMTATATLAAVLIVIYINRILVKPINALAVAASKFVSDKSEAEQQNTIQSALSTLNIHTGDEIENLFESIKTMESDINKYIENLTAVTAEKERIGAELDVATKIQASMLPCIFPPYPDRKEFDIYATMQPAKEVGGDFYDFFLIDEDHLAVVIADVSGKGVPAALFMVIAKTLIKNQAQAGLSPDQVFTSVNAQLCENNDAGMFVTAWMGVLQISTGNLIYVNAGHNPPLVKKKDGSFEFLRSRPGLVLAGMEGIRYKQNELQLDQGDCLYLYTDGVTEATNNENELYGEDRLQRVLNQRLYTIPSSLLSEVKADIDRFVLEAPQFDDITMLALMIREESNG